MVAIARILAGVGFGVFPSSAYLGTDGGVAAASCPGPTRAGGCLHHEKLQPS